MKLSDNHKGVSLIAAVFIIVILGFMGVMFVSMISTGSLTAANDAQSAQALYVAEGGTEYALNQFRNGAACNALNYNNIILGQGSFTTTGTPYNPTSTTLSAAISNVATVIPVASTVGYAPHGRIIIESEVIEYATIVGNTFTGVQRGVEGTAAAAHASGQLVAQNFCLIVSTGAVGNAQRVVERSVRQIFGSMMVYAKLNTDGTPYYRLWDGVSWGLELTATGVSASIQYMILKFARTRNEAILGTLDSTGDIRVQVWDGTAWSATLLLANVGTTDDNYRGFDIEYETNGDRAIVVYNDGTSDPDYRTWDGGGWSAAVNIDIPLGGSPNWIEMARNPLAGSNEIAMIVLNSSTDVYGMRWTGGGWSAMGAPFAAWDTAASTSTYKAIHVAYEQQTGRAIFVWGTSTANRMRYRIWNSSTLNLGAITVQDITNIGGNTANWVRLAPDPSSNNIMLGIQDNQFSPDLITSLWNGAAWDGTGTQHDSSVEDTSRTFDLVYETAAVNAGRLWLVWGNGSSLSRRQWSGAAWGGIATTGDDTSFVAMAAHPLSGAVLSAIYESTNSGGGNRDIWESHLTSGSAIWSPEVTIWGGRTVGAPVMERVAIAVERRPPPFIVYGWREVIR